MRLSRYPINTTKETPAEAEVVSHQLMLRAGLIRRVAAGIYSWLPLGLRALRKVEAIVREEMNRAGALELLMPAVQPAELWQESGRWSEYGPELLRLRDRHERDFVVGPTHEEVITDIARRELRSYRQLPVNFYQIQLKFRDEVRPRFGVMRAREFIMKDAYSFHVDEGSLAEGYAAMRTAYSRMFQRMRLDFRVGAGRHRRHRRQRLGGVSGAGRIRRGCDRGLAMRTSSPPTSNSPRPCRRPRRAPPRREPMERSPPREHAPSPNSARSLGIPPERCLKTLLVAGVQGSRSRWCCAAITSSMRSRRRSFRAWPRRCAWRAPPRYRRRAAATAGLHRPGGPQGRARVRRSRRARGRRFRLRRQRTGPAFERRQLGPRPARRLRARICATSSRAIRVPRGKGRLRIVRGIEVGHIFQLGRKYSRP